MESSPWKLMDKKLNTIKVVAATMDFSPESCGVKFPESPKEGEIFTLVDFITAPTYLWTFRYNPASISYRWEFIGGKYATVFGIDVDKPLNALTNSGWDNGLGDRIYYQSGNTFVLPYAGEYEFSGGVIIESVKNIRVSTQMLLDNFSHVCPAWPQVLEQGFNYVPLPLKRLRQYNPGKAVLAIGSTRPGETMIRWSSFAVRPVRIQ
jgi:hypothetical protein